MKSVLTIFFLVACLFLSSLVAADIGVNKEPTVKETNYNADMHVEIGQHSYLYNNCKKKLSDARFELSYCADFIRGIGSAAYILSATLFSNGECAKENIEAHDTIKKFWQPTQVLQVSDIAKDYVAYVSEGNAPLAAFNNILRSEDEKMLSSSIVYNYKKYKSAKDAKEKLNFLKTDLNSKTARKLYESCLSVNKKLSTPSDSFDHSYCNATISGIWVGYALLQYQIPNYNNNEACADTRNDLVASFMKRFNRQMACYAPFRKDNQDIARAYTRMMGDFPVEKVMLYAAEPAGAGMAAAIQMSCEE